MANSLNFIPVNFFENLSMMAYKIDHSDLTILGKVTKFNSVYILIL